MIGREVRDVFMNVGMKRVCDGMKGYGCSGVRRARTIP